MTFPDSEAIAAALSRHSPRSDEDVPAGHKAAVAWVVRDRPHGPEALFIRRAEHPRDPWSGQMGFPGGRVDPEDASPLATAIRETREEIGLDLSAGARHLGRLSEVRTHLPPGLRPRCVVPFGFALSSDPSLALNHEVKEVVWVPLEFFADRANRHSFTWVRQGLPFPTPCYRFEGRVIWGLTLRMVDELVQVVAAAGDG